LNPASLPAGAAARTTRHTARQTRIAVTAPAPFRATFRTLYWPEWDISLWQNGERQKTYPAAEVAITRPGGLLQAQLPAGEYEIRLERRATPIRRAATVLSAASLAALAGLVWFGRRRRGSGRTAPAPAPAFSRRQAIIIGGAIVLGALGVQAAAGRLRVQSPPDVAFGAQRALRVDFGDAIRLLGADLPPAVVSPGQTVAATAYWRALRPLANDYAVFLHLDAPDGQTVAAAGEQHPANIPTSHWPPGLYLRHPLQLTIPPGALPVRYTLRVGLYNPQSGVRLPVAGDSQTAFAVGQVWVRPAAAPAVPPGPRARFGESIQLLGARFDEPAQTVTLYWQTDAPLPTGYSIFLHQLDAGGTVVGQADGAPFGNLYALSDWRPGQVVADARPLGGSVVRRLLVGVYSPASGERLPAVDNAGHPLPGNALSIAVPAQLR
ncbi:MAG: hypothetical protein ACE5G8_17750, partial [Anaerolineae bacterium]